MARMPTRRLADVDLGAALAGLNVTLDEIAAGRLRCSAATRARIEGAVVALQAVITGVAPTLAALGTE